MVRGSRRWLNVQLPAWLAIAAGGSLLVSQTGADTLSRHCPPGTFVKRESLDGYKGHKGSFETCPSAILLVWLSYNLGI